MQMQITGNAKTLEELDTFEGGLRRFLAAGDAVDDAMYWYFLEMLPPRTMDSDLFQVGEADDHGGPDDAPRYATFQRHRRCWYYTGPQVAGVRVELLKAGS